MDKLIQTQFCNIIYGEFKGNPNEELFRCAREDETCLKNYINRERRVVGFENDYVEDLHNVPGKKLIGYWRMYFRGGWNGRWMLENGTPSEVDCIGVNNIIDWICENFKSGCSFYMQEYFEKNFKRWGGETDTRYLIKPQFSEHYKIMVDTKYGNGDYPVRIYVYEKENANEES